MRPPGGGLGEAAPGSCATRACATARRPGREPAVEDGIAVLPFEWRHVDAACVLPPLGSVRRQISGSEDTLGPDRFTAFLEGELDRLVAEGGFLTIVLHLFMQEWLGEERLNTLLDRLGAAARSEQLIVAPLAEVAERVLAEPDEFPGPVALDTASWSA